MFSKPLFASWGDMDFNAHMRNTAFLDKAADVRMMFFAENGFPMSEFLRLRLGPVVMKDEVEYRREVVQDTDAMRLVALATRALTAEYRAEGFNIGVNQGRIAGAGIADHLHIHVVPRWGGDTNFLPVLGDPEWLASPSLQAICRRQIEVMRQALEWGRSRGLPVQVLGGGSNTLFADAKGQIAYLHPQFIPRRDDRFDYTKPVDGADPATDWQGLHELAEAPQVRNPAGAWSSARLWQVLQPPMFVRAAAPSTSITTRVAPSPVKNAACAAAIRLAPAPKASVW